MNWWKTAWEISTNRFSEVLLSNIIALERIYSSVTKVEQLSVEIVGGEVPYYGRKVDALIKAPWEVLPVEFTYDISRAVRKWYDEKVIVVRKPHIKFDEGLIRIEMRRRGPLIFESSLVLPSTRII